MRIFKQRFETERIRLYSLGRGLIASKSEVDNMDKKLEAKAVACPGCGALFICGAELGLANCWCMDKPIGLFEPELGACCYCPECLDKRVSEPSLLAT